jgi:hypothetical protein
MANALTKTPQTQALNLSDIRTDGGTQARAGIDQAVVAEYASAIGEGADFPPLVVFSVGEELWLADGFHRLAAYRAAGVEEVDCLLKRGTQRDAVLWSVGANSTHGLRRSNQDKRNAVSKLLGDAEWVQWSDREIAKRCGVGAPLVGSIRMSLKEITVLSVNPNKEGPTTRTYVDQHGHTSTMKVENIGAKPTAAPEDKPAFGLSKEDDDAQLEQMRAEYLESLPAEVKSLTAEKELLQAQLEVAQADDLKAEAMKWRQISEHNVREHSHAMDRAKEARDREAWVMKQLRRCGKAVGEDNPGKIGARVEALAQRAREAA